MSLRLALAQTNPVLGDFKGNVEQIKSCLQAGRKYGADVILFPELALTGYPPEDLLLKAGFVDKNLDALKSLIPHTRGIAAVIGYTEPAKNALYNSAALVANGKHIASYRKMLLPNYGVFDEKRYFTEGTQHVRFTLNGVTLGLSVCEDIWDADGPGKLLFARGGL